MIRYFLWSKSHFPFFYLQVIQVAYHQVFVKDKYVHTIFYGQDWITLMKLYYDFYVNGRGVSNY